MTRNFTYLLAFCFLLLFITRVDAIGVTPGRLPVDFSPGLERTLGFTVLNSEHKELSIVLTVQGELNTSIALSENLFTMHASEESKQVQYTIKLPDQLKPGQHHADIVVLALPEKNKIDQAYVGAAIAVITELVVYVPYPGKYLEGELNVIGSDQNQETTFVLPLYNKGNLDIVRAKANIDIYSKLNEKVASFNTESISLKSTERGELVTKWKAAVPVGTYRAVATVIYDDQTFETERQFNVGNQVLELQQVNVKDFTLGDIAQLEMLVENKWSEPAIGAYAQTQIFDKEGKVMADFKSPTYDIQPLTKANLISYWDTGGVHIGTYDASVFLRFGQKSSQKDLQLKVSDHDITILGLGYVISEKKSSGTSSTMTILFIVIGVLVLLNIVWFLVIRKMLHRST